MESGREAVERWLPYDLDEDRLDNFLLHRLAHPAASADDDREPSPGARFCAGSHSQCG